MNTGTVELTSYRDARDGFRNRDLRQALYDEGQRLMGSVIVNLHGDEHRARRRLENRLFSPETFAWYERHHMPGIVESVLAPLLRRGRADLLPLARDAMLRLSVDVAGVDLDDGDVSHFADLMGRLARASTVAHATGDHAEIIRDGDDALDAFRVQFYEPSRRRRAERVDAVERGDLDEAELSRDVLTTLLRNQDRLELPDDTVLREIAYYPWVGSHSTAAQFVHAMHHLFEWIAEHPADRARLIDDDVLRQRFVHESMRLHPASPVAVRVATTDVELKSGVTIAAGATVVIDVEGANRDVAAVGPDPDAFDPTRRCADDVPPWGLSFGSGFHACVGRELAGGSDPTSGTGGNGDHVGGAVALMAGRLLQVGARPDPADPPTLDTTTTRTMWGRYPVVFEATA